MTPLLHRCVGAVLCAVFLGAAGPAATALAARDTVVIGMAQEPDTLGRFSTMSAARVVENALFTLVAPYTDRWQRQPMLVDRLPSLENGSWRLLPGGRMQVIWAIRRGLTWHDGRPVYPFGRPRIHRLIFRFILDSTVLQAAVMTGAVDVSEINSLGVEQMIEIERRTPAVGTFYTPSLRADPSAPPPAGGVCPGPAGASTLLRPGADHSEQNPPRRPADRPLWLFHHVERQ